MASSDSQIDKLQRGRTYRENLFTLLILAKTAKGESLFEVSLLLQNRSIMHFVPGNLLD